MLRMHATHSLLPRSLSRSSGCQDARLPRCHAFSECKTDDVGCAVGGSGGARSWPRRRPTCSSTALADHYAWLAPRSRRTTKLLVFMPALAHACDLYTGREGGGAASLPRHRPDVPNDVVLAQACPRAPDPSSATRTCVWTSSTRRPHFPVAMSARRTASTIA